MSARLSFIDQPAEQPHTAARREYAAAAEAAGSPHLWVKTRSGIEIADHAAPEWEQLRAAQAAYAAEQTEDE